MVLLESKTNQMPTLLLQQKCVELCRQWQDDTGIQINVETLLMRKFFELFTNDNGRASTTGFIQFFGFLVMAGVLIYAVYLDRSTVTDLFVQLFVNVPHINTVRVFILLVFVGVLPQPKGR